MLLVLNRMRACNRHMKDFLTLAEVRHSVRSYTERKVEKEKIDLILKAGRLSPTGCYHQCKRLLVVTTSQGLEKEEEAGKTYSAPLAVVAFIKRDGS